MGASSSTVTLSSSSQKSADAEEARCTDCGGMAAWFHRLGDRIGRTEFLSNDKWIFLGFFATLVSFVLHVWLFIRWEKLVVWCKSHHELLLLTPVLFLYFAFQFSVALILANVSKVGLHLERIKAVDNSELGENVKLLRGDVTAVRAEISQLTASVDLLHRELLRQRAS